MKDKMNNKQNKLYSRLLLALLAAAGMCYCFLKSGIFPFGTNSNLFSDLATQYVNFLVFFRESTWAEKIFSLTKGFGGQTFGLLSYYTFSPFNFIVYLFRPENIETALFVIFIARAVFMAENMFCYLSEHSENNIFNIGLSLRYTFYPFFTRYYFNILWADCFALLPLLILGTEKIMDGKSGKLFVFAYVYSLVSNYYIAYMSSLFVLCWFAYRFILEYGFNVILAVKKAVRMAYYTVISIMLSAPVLLPSFFLLAQGKFGDETISSWRVVKPYDFSTLPVSLFEGVMPYEYTPHLTGCAVCIFLVIAFLANRNISRKERAISAAFLLFMAAGFMFRPLGYIWHGLSAPQGFHNRQTYLYAFALLAICGKSVTKLDFSSAVKSLAVLLAAYPVAFYCCISRLGYSVEKLNIIPTMASVVVCIVCFILVKKSPEEAKNMLGVYICLNVIYMGGYFMSGQYNGDKPFTMAPSAGEFKDSYLSTQAVIDSIDDDGFYRIEDPTRWSQNQAMTHGYNSVSHYSSVFESKQKEMFMYYGFDDTYYSTTYSRSLPLNDFVFGIKYVMSSDASLVTNHYDVVQQGEKTVYYNPFYIPVVYTGTTNEVETADYWVDTVNNMAIALTGTDIYRADGNADYSKLKMIAETIRQKECKLIENNGMFLSFSTGETEDSYMLSSLMYDECWRVKVNGQPVKQQPYMQYFMSVPLENGADNIVEMAYIPQGLTAGIAIMTVALVVIAVHCIIKNKKSSTKEKA